MKFAAALPAAVLAGLIHTPVHAQSLAEARAAYLAAWEAAPLAVSKAVFVSAPATGYGLYEDRGSNVFAVGQPISIYLEPVGYGWVKEDSGLNKFGTEIGLRILSPQGQELFSKDGFLTLTTQSADRPTEFFGNVTLNLTGLEPGSYVLDLKLSDIASDETASLSMPIEVQ